MVRLAPGITAPEGSVTVPLREVKDCPSRPKENANPSSTIDVEAFKTFPPNTLDFSTLSDSGRGSQPWHSVKRQPAAVVVYRLVGWAGPGRFACWRGQFSASFRLLAGL